MGLTPHAELDNRLMSGIMIRPSPPAAGSMLKCLLPEWAESAWNGFERGELGWLIERIAAGEYRGQIAWVARRVTPAMAQRWPALKLGQWIIVDVDPYTGPTHAQTRPHEPGRLIGPFPRDEEELELPF